ncbi:MAG: hypothetical protein JWM27_3970 [Gemmatimonadetes bacterium]|nr:hypothetical protein [Gemmatimonadota bacterium]
MRRKPSLPFLAFLLASLAACSTTDARQAPASGAAAAPPAAVTVWRFNPNEEVQVRGGDPLYVETGPHVVVWPAGGPVLSPPYTVRATLQKHTGRVHEGTGLLFGGSDLDKTEDHQSYSYFLTRGDGSFLIKLRRGAQLPIIQDWTTHPAIHRDGEDGGRPNELEVRVTPADVAFLVNGTEVAHYPTSRFMVRGIAGLRVSHELSLEVTGFQARAGVPAPPARP